MSANTPFSDIQRRNFEAAARLAQLSLEHTQQMLAAQTRLAHELINENITSTKAELEAAADPQKLIALRAEHAQKTAQTLMNSAKEIAELGSTVRSEFSHLLTEQLAAGNKELTDAFQGFLHTLPGNNMNFFAGIQETMANTTKAFQQMMGTVADGTTPRKKK